MLDNVDIPVFIFLKSTADGRQFGLRIAILWETRVHIHGYSLPAS
jgi:hypothetical protein